MPPAAPTEPDPLFAAASRRQRGPRFGRLAGPLLHYGFYLLFHLIAWPVLGLRSAYRARRRAYRGLVLPRLLGGSKPPYRARWTIVYAGGMGEKRAGFAFAETVVAHREKEIAVLVQATNASQIGHATIAHGIMPFNNPISVLLFLWRWRPKAILGVEFWDNHHLSAISSMLGIRTAVFNVPVTEQAVAKVNWRNRWRYELIGAYACQGPEHVERMRRRAQLPEDALVLTGPVCIRVDPVQGLQESPTEVRARYRAELGLDDRHFPVVVAGSTYREEELILLDAFERLRKTFSNAALILAPRGVRRPGGCDSALVEKGVSFLRRSEGPGELPKSNVALIDVTGELKYLYSVGHVAFVGGSMGFQGAGHTPVEAMAWYLPITVGPAHPQQKIIIDRLLHEEAATICHDAGELAEAWERYAKDEALRRRVESNLQRMLADSDEMIIRIYDHLCA